MNIAAFDKDLRFVAAFYSSVTDLEDLDPELVEQTLCKLLETKSFDVTELQIFELSHPVTFEREVSYSVYRD